MVSRVTKKNVEVITEALEELGEHLQEDLVNSPGHYQDADGRGPEGGGIECCDAIRSALGKEGFIAYLRGSLMSQTWRLTRKPDGTGGVQDAEKAAWYAKKIAETLAEEG